MQVFDLVVGTLNTADYRVRPSPHPADLERIGGVPTIHFGTGTATILEDIREAAAMSSARTGGLRSTRSTDRRRLRHPGQPRPDPPARPDAAHVPARRQHS